MTVPTRETIYLALFALVNGLLAPGATPAAPGVDPTPGVPTAQRPFNLVSREVIEVQRVPPLLQPVLFMDEAMEDYVKDGSDLYHRRWTVYFHVGCTSSKGTPVPQILNPLLDLLEVVLAPQSGDNLIGLGDLITGAQLSGLSIKNLGQNSTDPQHRQAVAYVPFEIVWAGG